MPVWVWRGLTVTGMTAEKHDDYQRLDARQPMLVTQPKIVDVISFTFHESKSLHGSSCSLTQAVCIHHGTLAVIRTCM